MYIDKVEELAKKIYGVKITKNPLGNPMYEFTGTELAMFAELLIKECASIVEGFEIIQEVALDEYVDFEASDVLKQHFGIEE